MSDKYALRKYTVIPLGVADRPFNPGAEITESLSRIQKISLDPAAMDLAANCDSLPELPGRAMSNKLALGILLEIPKWARRGKILAYGFSLSMRIVQMKFLQSLHRNIRAGRGRASDISQIKKDIKDYAFSRGFISGVTKIDRRFIAGQDDRLCPYDTVIVLGMEMDPALIDEIPHPGRRLFDFETYVRSSREVFRVARFIKRLGLRCRAVIPFDGTVKFIPHAASAGLAELGASGVGITREFGPRVRWCIISIDAGLPVDEPVNLDVADFCEDCLACIRSCPGKAIPEKRLWWRGVYKRKIDDTKCFPFFKKYDGCGICIKVCPFHKYGYSECMTSWLKDGTIPGRKNV